MRRHEFEIVVDRALDSLPAWVIDEIDNLVVVVEDEPPPDQEDLLGIYEGIALNEREDYSGVLPDRIVIYRRPHLELGLSSEDLEREIRKTVLHELAHHLGIGDERLEELGWG
ncbi:MAG: metallopeptidase family protein [Actinobacteria bacterium]|nr:metallopeptidase family protein [Actinomycetota bacterium]MCI0677472.1 metallopeptidase family protein [Actinomycetota bacterium]